jgi:hypothetical protein
MWAFFLSSPLMFATHCKKKVKPFFSEWKLCEIVYLHSSSQVKKLLQLGRYKYSIDSFFSVRLQFLPVATPRSLEGRLINKNFISTDGLTYTTNVTRTVTCLEESIYAMGIKKRAIDRYITTWMSRDERMQFDRSYGIQHDDITYL